jgi:hypothetical protein
MVPLSFIACAYAAVGPRLAPSAKRQAAPSTAAAKDAGMRALAAAMLLHCFSLGGCATSTGSSLMDAHAESPARPKTSGYPAVQDLPPKREKPMTADERLKLQKELIAARDRRVPTGKARGALRAPNA